MYLLDQHLIRKIGGVLQIHENGLRYQSQPQSQSNFKNDQKLMYYFPILNIYFSNLVKMN